MVSFSFLSSSDQSAAQAGPIAIGQALADHLAATQLHPGLKVVDCALQSGRLGLTLQHRAPEANDPNTLLKELETTFRDLMPAVGMPDGDWPWDDELPVRLSLKLPRSHRPYATYTFTWRIADAASTVFPELADPAQPVAAPPASASPLPPEDDVAGDPWPDANSEALATDSAATADQASAMADGTEAAAATDPPADSADEAASSLVAFNEARLAPPETQVEPPTAASWLQQTWQASRRGLSQMAPYWSYTVAGVILIGSGMFAYGLTRPCVVGSCDRLERAAELHSEAQIELQGSPDNAALNQAQADLQTAMAWLMPVPRWSPYYTTAQADLSQYQTELQYINALLEATTLATEAANLSQNPPHPVEHWVDTHLLWQQATDRLSAIPTDSLVYGYSQEKLKEYQANATAIDRRITAEETAEANFDTALQTAQLAQQRMESAETLAGWQLAAKEWQAAIDGFNLIPQGTMAYDDAQNYLEDYRRQLSVSQTRANQEDRSAQFYAQAVQAARAAETYEAKNQWTLAVQQWQQALRYATRIPANTSLSADGAALLESYQPALDNAQARLRTAVALQDLTKTVGTLCGASGTPCTVSEDDSQIKITLANQYAAPLRQAITPPTTDGSAAFAHELTPSTQTLIEQVITISHQVNRQVAIYDTQGSFVARYRPDLGGFSKN